MRALHAQVERLLRERRSEYAALQGWAGPHRCVRACAGQRGCFEARACLLAAAAACFHVNQNHCCCCPSLRPACPPPACLSGCLAARFDELPVAQLPARHDDPRVAAGLAAIRQLDEQLKEVMLKVRSSVLAVSECSLFLSAAAAAAVRCML